ncbi:MAG: 4Fe-4S binding protein [Deltaproteobacteria bacterium]|nr:4Fe-4S binding protein [Deltaproteobacteria bacterium]
MGNRKEMFSVLYKRVTDGIRKIDDFLLGPNHNVRVKKKYPRSTEIQKMKRLIAKRRLPKEALSITVDPQKCTKCMKCDICSYDALVMESGIPRIILGLCPRCGVCESKCPTAAIRIQIAA